MADEEPTLYRQFLRSRTENGQEVVREVVSPSLLDANAATAAETQAGRAFQGFVAPGDMNALGAQPQQPPPPPAEGPGIIRQTLQPERSLLSQAPSIVGGTLGGIGGAALGAITGPFAPVAVPAFASIGAGLGSGGMEALQAAAERAPGATSPVSEPGTPWERGARAGIRGGVFEGATNLVRIPAQWIGRAVGPTLKAAEAVAPVLKQNLPQGAALLERGIAELAPAAADQPTLLRAWWQDVAPKGAAAVTAAWDAMTPAQQAVLAGGQHDAMQSVVSTLRASQAAVPWQNLGTRSAVLYGAGRMVGYPGVGEVAAAVPAAVSVARAAAPKVAAPMLLSPTGSQFLAALPQVARAAGPWASGLLSGGAQLGGAMADEGPVVFAPPYAPPG